MSPENYLGKSITGLDRPIQRVGSIEPDIFVINDIVLTISPSQISVNKGSFNHNWQTIRTRSPRKEKSGHAIARVSISIIFKGEDINDKLIPLIAGLRASPFAAIYNPYLEGLLLDDTEEVTKSLYSLRGFKNIVLVLSSATISTLGHEGKVDCLGINLDFLWFNYLPYTPIWAYKTGTTYDRPGYPWESDVWKKFYQPLMKDALPIEVPHPADQVPATIFMWREYQTVASGDVYSNQATVDLLDTLLKKPEELIDAARVLLAQGDNPVLRDNLFDTLYRNAVKSGMINPSEEVRQRLLNNELPNLGTTIEGMAGPLFQRILKQETTDISAKEVRGSEQENIKSLIGLVKKRIEQLHNVNAAGYTENTEAEDYNDYVKLQSFPAEVIRGNRSDKVSIGNLTLLGRKRFLRIDPSQEQIGNVSIIEQVVITISNTIALIPMIGYTYPTCQFLGGTDISVSFIMNTTNKTAKTINKMYNIIERMALRFRQVPAGFRNLVVYNDILGLLGIKEFITQDISSENIQGQPGRSRVILTLSENGITSQTKLEDLEQEFVRFDKSIYEEIWTVLDKYLVPITEAGSHFKTQNNTLKKYAGDKNSILAYALIVKGIPFGDNRKYALFQLVQEAANNYNDFLTKAHHHIFGDVGTTPTEAALYYAALKSLQGDTEYSFVPGLDRVLKSIANREKENIKEMGKKAGTVSGINLQSEQLLRRKQEYAQQVEKYGKDEFAKKVKEEIEKLTTARLDKLQDLGLRDYLQKQKDLFSRIQERYIILDEFKHIHQHIADKGLGRGIMAYPDFKQQLSSVSELIGRGVEGSQGILLDIDPDVYMWYPAYAGLNSLENFIDPYIIENAKALSLRSYEDAQKKVGDFFKDSYLNILKDDLAPAPLEQLKEYSKGVVPPPLYNGISYDCSLRSSALSGEPIRKQLLIDPVGKAHTNLPTKDAPLSCANVCVHTTNMIEQWTGVSQGTNPTESKPFKDISGQNNHGSANPASSFGERKGIEPNIVVDWDNISTQSEYARDPLTKYYCPVATYTSISRIGSCAMRDIGKSREGWEYRNVAAKKDWQQANTINSNNQIKQWVDPARAEKEAAALGITTKPISSWTYDEYWAWKTKTKRGRSVQVKGKTQYQDLSKGVGYLHKGADIACPVGTPVYAIADGTIQESTYYKGAGLTIGIVHPTGTIKNSRYLHLQEIRPSIKKGVSVKAGQCIGVSGRSGQTSMGPHLHFETWASDYKASKPQLLNPVEATTGISWNIGRYNNIKRFSTEKTRTKIADNRRNIPSPDITTTVAAPLNKAIQQFETDLLRGQAQSLLRAYPTFKLYFIEDDKGERKRLAYDDFFSYNSVKSIRVIRNRNIAADLCELFITNISGILSNRKFSQQYGSGRPRDKQGNVVQENTNPFKTDTVDENPLASLLLQEGVHISLRLGFSSDPDRLETVFNGIITEIEFSETEDLIRILAQSYAVELVQDIKGLEKPENRSSWSLFGWSAWGLADDASTARILEEVISEPEVLHFGRWEPYTTGTSQRDLLKRKWQFKPNPADDNIFAPPPDLDLAGGEGVFLKNLRYTIYHTTIWDIFKEMELRHPNFVALPVPYKDETGERMTMFFGLPNQLYFARFPSIAEISTQEKLREEQDRLIKKIEQSQALNGRIFDPYNKFSEVNKLVEKYTTLQFGQRASEAISIFREATKGNFSFFLNAGTVAETAYRAGQWASQNSGIPTVGNVARSLLGKVYQDKRLTNGLEAGFIKPFRKYHLITSGQHIIANNIRANSRDIANTIVIEYGKGKDINYNPLTGVSIKEKDAETLTVKLDAVLPTEEIRTEYCNYINVVSDELAKRYGLGRLIANVRQAYKGDIQIIGDPSIKPIDICYLFDEVNDMVGPIEVEQVIHTLDQDNGFRTEIKPNMLAVASEWSLLHAAEAMGVVMEGALHSIFGKSTGGNTLQHLSPFSNIIGTGLGYFGGFLTRKILDYTQLGHPIIMSPLMFHGRIFAGGIPVRKIPASVWETWFGEWNPVVDRGYSMWLEDKQDDIVQWIKKGVGAYSVGTFFDNGE